MSLLAAQNTASLSGSNKSDAGSVGISFGTSGFGITASASSARGKEAGDDLIHSNTRVTAGNRVNIRSGGATPLQSALVPANSLQPFEEQHRGTCFPTDRLSAGEEGGSRPTPDPAGPPLATAFRLAEGGQRLELPLHKSQINLKNTT